MNQANSVTIRIPDDLPKLLRAIPLLNGLDDQTLADLARHLVVRRANRREFVVMKGDPGDTLLFLFAGRMQVVDVTEDGREVGLNMLNPGDHFGEMSVIDGRTRSASVVAIQPSLIALLGKTHALRLFFGNPLVAERLLRLMVSRLRVASSFRAILSIPNAFQRVFAMLHRLAREVPGGLIVIDPLPTQQEIAIMINTSRETVSRALNALIEQGIVEKDTKRLIIREPARLSQAAASPQFQPEAA